MQPKTGVFRKKTLDDGNALAFSVHLTEKGTVFYRVHLLKQYVSRSMVVGNYETGDRIFHRINVSGDYEKLANLKV